MNILVTGSSGVIGQNLVPYLSKNGHLIIPFDIKDNVLHDITNAQSIERVFKKNKIDLCVHMAAQVGRLNGEDYPQSSVNLNIIGTLNVVRACIDNNVFLINFSTSEVYGHNSVLGTPDILEQNGMYGITKLAAEGVVKHYCDSYGLQAVSIRPFMVYGPHEIPRGEYRSAISNFIHAAHNGQTIHAHAGCSRSWCYAEDFVRGLSLVIDRHKEFTKYESFSIGTEEYRSMEDAARIVVDVVGSGNYEVVEVPLKFASAVKEADFSRIKSMGFEQKIDLETGVALTYEWMLDRGLLTKW